MASFWEDLFSGAGGAYGYKALYDQLGDQKGDISQGVSNLQGQVGQMGEFQPWSVKSAVGTSSYDPSTGTMGNYLRPEQQGYANQQGRGASEMFGRAMQDPAQREGDIYSRIREMQRPGEERQYSSMNANLFGGGRGGMSSAEYGGSPEQHAFGMAQGEARNQAGYQAMGQAQQEMQNYAGIGQQMFSNQYVPGQQLQGQLGSAINNQQLQQKSQLDMASLFAQLGLGGMTADTNLSNIQGKAFGDMVGAGADMAGGVGGAIDSAGGMGGLWDMIKGMF